MDSHETILVGLKIHLKTGYFLGGLNLMLKYIGFVFYVFGQGQRKEALIPSINSLNKNEKIKIKNLENFNDFIYIDDVINLFKNHKFEISKWNI